MKKGKEEKENKVSGRGLFSLLKRVHLSGLINECVLSVEEGLAKVQAVDMSNSVFVSSKEKISGIKDMTVGVGNLPTLTSFLSDGSDVELTISEKYLSLRKPNRGTIRTILLVKEQVPTATQGDGEETVKKVLGFVKSTIPLSKTKVADLVEYISMVGCGSVFFRIKSGLVLADNGFTSEQQFSLRLGKVDEKSEELSVEVYSQYLLAVLKNLEWPEKNPPKLGLGGKVPLLIQQDKENLWALTPIME